MKYSDLQNSEKEDEKNAFFRLDIFFMNCFSQSDWELIANKRLDKRQWLRLSNLSNEELEIELFLILKELEKEQMNTIINEWIERQDSAKFS